MTFQQYLQENLDARNKAVDIEAVVDKSLDSFRKRGSKISKEHVKAIADYMKGKQTFSMNKMMDYFDDKGIDIMPGWVKSAIDAVKEEIRIAGYGSKGSESKKVSRAERIDKYLRQKDLRR